MSSILLEESSNPLFEIDDADGGLRIVGQSDEANLFKVVESGEFDGVNVDDTISGGLLGDIISAGAGNDIIFGQAGDDFIEGEEGNDMLLGGDGDDVLRGGTGSDIMTGGAGTDTFEFFAEDFAAGELDTITDFDDDIIVLRGIGADADVSYNSTTGKVSVDGQEVIKLDDDPNITIENIDGSDDWELF